MLQIGNPFPLFLDLQGALLDAGYIYIGTANNDPEVSPANVYWDTALNVPAAQPLRTRGGYIVNNGVPAAVYTGETDYSQRVKDADGNLVVYVASAQAAAGSEYQPVSDNLTAIAAVPAQPFGRSLLAAASATAAKALLALGSYLATAGGTVSGNITRQGAGPHLFHNDNGFVSGRVFITSVAASDPTGQIGDIWMKYTD